MLLNVFDNDAFNMVNLTGSINLLPYQPARLASQFTVKPISSLTAVIEYKEGRLSLIQTQARGTMPEAKGRDRRKIRAFPVLHLPHNDQILADDITGVRAFGSETEVQTLSTIVNERLETLRQDHEFTHEWHRIGAIKGIVLDADGTTTLYNLFTEFGLTQTAVTITFGTDSVTKKALGVKRSIEDALGATRYSRIRILCGSTFFDKLVTDTEVKTAYERWQNGSFLRDDPRYNAFEFPSGVFWEEYRGSVGATPFVAATKAHAYPEDAPGLFAHYAAPADFNETVGTPGKVVYAKQERMPFDKGVNLHTQSNPLMMVTRPMCLVALTAA